MRYYEHGGDVYRNEVTLDFSVNTNPFGMPQTVKKALTDNVEAYALYPDPRCEQLSAAIAEYEGVLKNYVLCGNGAADLIYRLVFALKPKTALVCAPTFSEYERAVLLRGGVVKYHSLERNDDFCLTERFFDSIAQGVDMVFVCNPNNPTGKLSEPGLLNAIANKCSETGVLLVVDECFLPFTKGESLKTHAGVVVIKAFTKTFAMAGLRLGYMLCGDETILRKVREFAQIWSVSAPAQTAGLAALKSLDWMRETVRKIDAERKFLTDGLRASSFEVWDSDVNFILFKSEKPLYEKLLKKGILLRSCASFQGLDERYARIAVKTREENEKLLQSLKDEQGG